MANLKDVSMEAIPIAKGMNYTLVIPPFHRHPRMEMFVENPNNEEEKEPALTTFLKPYIISYYCYSMRYD